MRNSIFLLTILVLLANCFGPCSSSSPAQARPKAPIIDHPIAFAQFNNPAFAPAENGVTPVQVNDSKDDGNPIWVLKNQPSKFVWQHPLKPDQNLRVELIDSVGRPYPTQTVITKSETQYVVELQILSNLPENTNIYLIGHTLDNNGNKQETWLKKLVVLTSAN